MHNFATKVPEGTVKPTIRPTLAWDENRGVLTISLTAEQLSKLARSTKSGKSDMLVLDRSKVEVGSGEGRAVVEIRGNLFASYSLPAR